MESQKKASEENASNIGGLLNSLGWILLVIVGLGGLIVFIIWLTSLDNRSPISSIEEFDINTPNTTTNSTRVIFYDLKLKNDDTENAIDYFTLNVTFYYKPKTKSNLTAAAALVPIGNAQFESFYQRRRKSTHRTGYIQAASGVNWENPISGTALKAELRMNVRYRNPLHYKYTKRHNVVLGADLQVNDQGSLVKAKGNKGIKLTSSGSPNPKINTSRFGPILLLFVFIHFIL